jgi:serine/threonine protein kinase
VTAPELVGMSARYTIIREVGHGSTARVFLAVDQEQGRQVAVKVLRNELAASVIAARFLREIRYIRGLRHPNILPILDAAEEGDLLYFVMPYAEGKTLRARLTLEGPAPFSEVVRVASAVGDALYYAHGHNVVHRDLKPENILFDGDRVILCDFGVARAIVLSSTDDRLSSSGIAVGTPSYMSPEQTFMDRPIDGRCDIYALGCVVFEMLTGEVPFSGAGLMAQAYAHAVVPPRPIRTVRPEVPALTEAAVFWAMSKVADDRPQSGRAFVDKLRASLSIDTAGSIAGA